MKIRFDTPPAAAQQSNGLAVRYAAAKREVPRWRWYLMVLLISLPILYFALPFLATLLWRTVPAVVVLQNVVIKAPADGEVANLVREGAIVQQGAALAIIEPPKVAQAAVIGKVLPLILPPTAAGPDAPRQDPARRILLQALELARQDVARKRERVAALNALRREGAATHAEEASASGQLAQARAALLRAELDLVEHVRMQAQFNASTLAAASRGGRAIGGAGSEGQGGVLVEAPRAVAVSPFKGKVTAVMAVQGEAVTSSTELMTVQGDGPPIVEAYLSPSDVDLARKGRRATLRFLDGGEVSAEVEDVHAQAARVPADRLGPLSPRAQSIVVKLRPLTPLPAKYLIHQLPLNVRFGRFGQFGRFG